MILKELANGLNFFKTHKTPNQKVIKTSRLGVIFYALISLNKRYFIKH